MTLPSSLAFCPLAASRVASAATVAARPGPEGSRWRLEHAGS